MSNHSRGCSRSSSGSYSSRMSEFTGNHTPYVALDCEMVGVGCGGFASMLAQVAVVSDHGTVILNNMVYPSEEITDLRKHITGLSRWKLYNLGEPFKETQKDVKYIIQDHLLVGHAVHHDLQALGLYHPAHMIRDTSAFHLLKPHYMAEYEVPSLKKLVLYHFNRHIQVGAHDPAEDAREAMNLYKLVQYEWEYEVWASEQVAHEEKQQTEERVSDSETKLYELEQLLKEARVLKQHQQQHEEEEQQELQQQKQQKDDFQSSSTCAPVAA